ncbi:unnamed protein product [Acanthoscelides obtectus]|uniref:Uncharacterized protein n=1 Tax=Acanthoscelides obtectus TaxID=200917 RepID=A0A9P0KG82_ACAOB|nr:unnamed protein product [Acanthoscelides obtectus]CAK1657588.1 hypothetical protein AOBTE_LOCUS20431 [Acanthoscelides obtectus]
MAGSNLTFCMLSFATYRNTSIYGALRPVGDLSIHKNSIDLSVTTAESRTY